MLSTLSNKYAILNTFLGNELLSAALTVLFIKFGLQQDSSKQKPTKQTIIILYLSKSTYNRKQINIKTRKC